MTRERALELYREGVSAFRAGDRARSLALNEEALTLARELSDPELEALAMVGLSRVALRDGDYARVRKLASDALDLVSEKSGDAQLMPLHLLAAGTRLDGDYDEALELYTESLELSRRLRDDRMVAVELHNLGHVYMHLGRVDEADKAFADRLRVGPQADAYNEAMTDLNSATIAAARGDFQRASRLLDDATATLRGAGVVLDPDDAFEVEWLKERLAAPG